MPKITKILHKPEKERYWIFVDGEYCASIRERTFPAMCLTVGQEISCQVIKDLENYHWKHAYGHDAWEKEKVRLGKVRKLIETLDDRVAVEIVGFGADHAKFIAAHPEEAGKPDMRVQTRHGSIPVLLVEVTGTETMRGDTYWVRPDKLDYAQKYPDEDVWIILHYAQPQEKCVFIKPDHGHRYQIVNKEIRGSIEHYVEFTDDTPGMKSRAEFAQHLKQRIDAIQPLYLSDVVD